MSLLSEKQQRDADSFSKHAPAIAESIANLMVKDGASAHDAITSVGLIEQPRFSVTTLLIPAGCTENAKTLIRAAVREGIRRFQERVGHAPEPTKVTRTLIKPKEPPVPHDPGAGHCGCLDCAIERFNTGAKS